MALQLMIVVDVLFRMPAAQSVLRLCWVASVLLPFRIDVLLCMSPADAAVCEPADVLRADLPAATCTMRHGKLTHAGRNASHKSASASCAAFIRQHRHCSADRRQAQSTCILN